MKILYFTATGNSLQVTKYFGAEEVLSIPKLVKNGTGHIEDDVIGIVTPCYCGGLPLIVQRFLAHTKLKCSYLFGIITYGDMLVSAPLRLKESAMKHGHNFDYINAIQMTDSYLPMYEISDQLTKLPAKKVSDHLEKIKTDIMGRKQFIPKTGFMSKLFGSIMQAQAKKTIGNTADHRIYVDDHCTNCGICAKVCPVDNIEQTQKLNFLHHCEGCLACIHHCPVAALHVNKEKSTVHYRNAEISLDEIIESND